jgi:hypothetical protein
MAARDRDEAGSLGMSVRRSSPSAISRNSVHGRAPPGDSGGSSAISWSNSLEAAGKAPPGLHRFSDEITPERIISVYFNGDLIHFDRGSQQMSEGGARRV